MTTDTQEKNAIAVADRELKRRVTDYLFGYKVPMLRDIVEVEVFGDRVVLRGRVPLYYHKQMCISCCLRVLGVHTVHDQIVVEADNRVIAPTGSDPPANENFAEYDEVPRLARKPR